MKTLSFLAALAPSLLAADVVKRTVEYEHGDTTLQGFHAYDDAVEGERPGVLIVHQWTGLTDYERRRSGMLAELGYNVFALDIYGKGVRPQPPESGEVSGTYKKDRELFRERLLAGLEVLRSDERTDDDRVAAIGYCFGGTGVLELARAGADLSGVVSFHGGLAPGEGMAAEEGEVKTPILVCHGAADPHSPREDVEAFREEMDAVGADWTLILYSDAVHSFTQPMAGDDPSKGAAYQERADKQSWQHMRVFFDDIFAE